MLWSDAICIDQNSDIEKSQQVPMMEVTYSQATRVLVWLGDETKTSKQAIRFMGKMLDRTISRDDLFKGHAEQWNALEALMRMSWFTRRWIVQEIALARDAIVYCGDDEISWRDFCDAVALFELHYPDIKATFLNETYHYSRQRLGEVKALGACRLVKVTSNLFRKSTDGKIQRRLVTLESLVSSLTMFDATNSHDIVYAMVAIAKDIESIAQKERTVAPEAVPVSTPENVQDEDFVEPMPPPPPPGKRRRTTRNGPGALARHGWQDISRRAVDHSRVHGLEDDDERPRKGAERLKNVVKEVVSNRPSKFIVDYRRSFLRVCMDFVAFAILQSKSLDILCKPWVPEKLKEELDLPSWLLSTDACPFRPQTDGTFVRVNADPLVGENTTDSKRYSAAGTASRARRVTKASPEDGWGYGFFDRSSEFDDGYGGHRSLFVSGFVLAPVQEIKDKAEDGTIPNDWFRFAGWTNRSQLPPDHLWRTLVADRESDGSYIGSYYQRTLRDIVQEHTTRNSAFNVKAILATPQCDKTSEMVLERVLAVVPNRRLFKIKTSTMGELFGLAPAGARVGDLVCILYGCSVPVVLRQHETKIDDKPVVYYELLGDSYVHGIMEGDALDEQEKRSIRPRQFELR